MAQYIDHTRVAQKLLDQQGDISRLETERDGAYRERAHLVALLASLHPSHIGHTDPAAPDWAVVVVETPAGQLSWHIAPRDMDLFTHVRPTDRVCRGWDGHTTDEKYERVRQLTATAGCPSDRALAAEAAINRVRAVLDGADRYDDMDIVRAALDEQPTTT